MKFAIAFPLAALAASPALADHPLGGLGLGTGASITTLSATTLPKGTWAASFQVEHIAFEDISDARLIDLGAQGIEAHAVKSTTIPSLRLAYGVTDDFSIGLKLPYVDRRDLREAHSHTHEDGDVEVELHRLGDSEGVGDITLLGQYRILNLPAETLEAALLGGVKAPTGQTNRTTALGGQFETEHQPGSGSWDFLLGAALTKRFGALSLDGSVHYTIAGDGSQDTDLGDRLNYNLAASYRFGAAHDHAPGAAPHSHLAWDVTIELNGEHSQKQEIAGESDPNSGGNVVYLSPGVRLSGESWSVYLSYGEPIVRDLNGVQHEPDYRVVAGVAMGF
jgi:hypothetical protein